jgi:hypothetical protein
VGPNFCPGRQTDTTTDSRRLQDHVERPKHGVGFKGRLGPAIRRQRPFFPTYLCEWCHASHGRRHLHCSVPGTCRETQHTACYEGTYTSQVGPFEQDKEKPMIPNNLQGLCVFPALREAVLRIAKSGTTLILMRQENTQRSWLCKSGAGLTCMILRSTPMRIGQNVSTTLLVGQNLSTQTLLLATRTSHGKLINC